MLVSQKNRPAVMLVSQTNLVEVHFHVFSYRKHFLLFFLFWEHRPGVSTEKSLITGAILLLLFLMFMLQLDSSKWNGEILNLTSITSGVIKTIFRNFHLNNNSNNKKTAPWINLPLCFTTELCYGASGTFGWF